MKDAHWYEQAFYVLWKQHVRMIMPIEIRDPSKATEFVFESGLYYYNGKPKPILTAYQFPFITQRTNKHEVLAWGRAPLAGKLKIQVKSGKHWKVLKSFSVSKSEVFSSPIGFTGSGLFRATIGSHTSLTWNQSA